MAERASGLVSEAYEGRVRAGELEPDRDQRALVAKLDALIRDLERARLGAKSSALGWLFGSAPRPEAVRGLYIYGKVGRGKTMLMDLFHAALPGTKKRRAHFHDFMADVHARIHAFRQEARAKGGEARTADPIPPLAEALADEARLLCFDEFAVTDVADAMILSRLFTGLFERGVDVVATSNVAPADLYRDGLNRSFFTPFIELVRERMTVVHLDSPTDHRMAVMADSDVYLTGDDRRERFEALWARASEGITREPATVPVAAGRTLAFEETAGGWLRATFAQLCQRPLGAADYLALAERFRGLFLEGVPVMEHADRNAAKRFIALIDTLYDGGRLLVVEAEAAPDRLYAASSGTEAFEFARTVSRLTEMQGAGWRERTGSGAGTG